MAVAGSVASGPAFPGSGAGFLVGHVAKEGHQVRDIALDPLLVLTAGCEEASEHAQMLARANSEDQPEAKRSRPTPSCSAAQRSVGSIAMGSAAQKVRL
jgi:hypothetical protein